MCRTRKIINQIAASFTASWRCHRVTTWQPWQQETNSLGFVPSCQRGPWQGKPNIRHITLPNRTSGRFALAVQWFLTLLSKLNTFKPHNNLHFVVKRIQMWFQNNILNTCIQQTRSTRRTGKTMLPLYWRVCLNYTKTK